MVLHLVDQEVGDDFLQQVEELQHLYLEQLFSLETLVEGLGRYLLAHIKLLLIDVVFDLSVDEAHREGLVGELVDDFPGIQEENGPNVMHLVVVETDVKELEVQLQGEFLYHL